MSQIEYNRPFIPEKANHYISDCLLQRDFENGKYINHCLNTLKKNTKSKNIFLTSSCTSALEMIALLLELEVGDEIIMPSYTFVSTANAFVLRGAVPVFIDIRSDTLNINERLIEKAITEKTKAIVVVHYSGIACDMDSILKIAAKYKLPVIEDAAHCIDSYYKNNHLGTLGTFSTFSFHHTKNISAGLGGALLVNDDSYMSLAQTLYTKGTNRDDFIKGKVDSYTWVDIGSSFMMSELNAALLYSQLEMVSEITSLRLTLWDKYNQAFSPLKKMGIQLPILPEFCKHNAHIYYLVMFDKKSRNGLLDFLGSNNVQASFHFIPLHNSPAGKRFGRFIGSMQITNESSDKIIRLPLFPSMNTDEIDRVINLTLEFCKNYWGYTESSG